MKIAHCSIDENNKAKGGIAGNQTGKETCVREWYNKPWTVLLRHPEDNIANNIANVGFLLASPPINKLIGYDQGNRNSLHSVLKEVGYSIKTFIERNEPVESDCSAFVTAVAIASGVRALEYTGNAPTTSDMKSVFKKSGFEVITDPKYLTSPLYVKKGDILLKPGSHVVICCENGARYGMEDTQFFPKYEGMSPTLAGALIDSGIDSSKSYREKIYKANFTDKYQYTGKQNIAMLQKLKAGTLVKPFT